MIRRGGSESFHSSGAIHACLVEGLKAAGLPEDAIQRVPTRDREAVRELLTMTDYVDVIVPRGGKGLVGLVQREARVPVFAHLEGICHIYVGATADPAMARRIVVNAKMRRTGICGAAETLLLDSAMDRSLAADILADLAAGGELCIQQSMGELARLLEGRAGDVDIDNFSHDRLPFALLPPRA